MQKIIIFNVKNVFFNIGNKIKRLNVLCLYKKKIHNNSNQF